MNLLTLCLFCAMIKRVRNFSFVPVPPTAKEDLTMPIKTGQLIIGAACLLVGVNCLSAMLIQTFTWSDAILTGVSTASLYWAILCIANYVASEVISERFPMKEAQPATHKKSEVDD